ncbi:MAG: cytochrome c maturation protein CcmE [Gammaproteobacteria bacterium]|nr:cytochrome c maturation protein CcmE [Gammaproteobacteria bacterium]
MNKKQKNRLAALMSLIFILGTAAGLILYALKQNINLFYTPTELLQAQLNSGQAIRLGGYVKNHSVHYNNSGQEVNFTITDRINEIKINYAGVLPNLFREGQSVVVTGNLNSQHVLIANQVLAKHDEKYMPPSIAKRIEQQHHGD